MSCFKALPPTSQVMIIFLHPILLKGMWKWIFSCDILCLGHDQVWTSMFMGWIILPYPMGLSCSLSHYCPLGWNLKPVERWPVIYQAESKVTVWKSEPSPKFWQKETSLNNKFKTVWTSLRITKWCFIANMLHDHSKNTQSKLADLIIFTKYRITCIIIIKYANLLPVFLVW